MDEVAPPIPQTPVTLTPAEKRSNPRLAAVNQLSSDVLNSVPCAPPSLRYRYEPAGPHTSIPDFSVLRVNSEVARSREADKVDKGQSRTQHCDDGLSSGEESPPPAAQSLSGGVRQHYDDGLSSAEGERYNDGLSSVEESLEPGLPAPAAIPLTVADATFANLPALSPSNSIERFHMDAIYGRDEASTDAGSPWNIDDIKIQLPCHDLSDLPDLVASLMLDDLSHEQQTHTTFDLQAAAGINTPRSPPNSINPRDSSTVLNHNPTSHSDVIADRHDLELDLVFNDHGESPVLELEYDKGGFEEPLISPDVPAVNRSSSASYLARGDTQPSQDVAAAAAAASSDAVMSFVPSLPAFDMLDNSGLVDSDIESLVDDVTVSAAKGRSLPGEHGGESWEHVCA